MKRAILQNLFRLACLSAGLAGCAGQTASPSALAPVSSAGDAAKAAQDLYVADFNANAVDLFSNSTYKSAGQITNGIVSPSDVVLDEKGRLYVANLDGPNVAEYDPGSTGPPAFVYSQGMHNPYSVTVDAHGNVFEGDLYGSVSEYAQGVNATVATCALSGIVFGIAVDSSGNVFVDYFMRPMGPANIAEFRGGLGKACTPKTLAKSGAPGGIALDKNGKLLVAEGIKVVVINPAHADAAVKIGSGFSSAISVRLNRANTLAFVTDNSADDVTVVSYPAGKNLTTIGSGAGLKAARAAVDAPNAVY